jgi:hypothetical protein
MIPLPFGIEKIKKCLPFFAKELKPTAELILTPLVWGVGLLVIYIFAHDTLRVQNTYSLWQLHAEKPLTIFSEEGITCENINSNNERIELFFAWNTIHHYDIIESHQSGGGNPLQLRRFLVLELTSKEYVTINLHCLDLPQETQERMKMLELILLKKVILKEQLLTSIVQPTFTELYNAQYSGIDTDWPHITQNYPFDLKK